jgi:hypothetical protein
MDKPTFTPHGRDLDVLHSVAAGAGVLTDRRLANRRVRSEGKRAGKDQNPTWESAFHAERGCLDGGLPLESAGPIPRH